MKSSGKTSEADVTNAPSTVPLIVGMGASAGGLEAFKTFFSNMPSDSGMAFVLVQHLSPEHISMMAELLGNATSMPVCEAEDGMAVQANHLYVIPPNTTMTIEKAHLVVKKPAPPREHRFPIDTFLLSLAQDQQENAVCIILSGTGTDGSLGLTAIKEHGGITFAQSDPDLSAMSGMPSSAEETGYVDHLLPVADIPAKLMEYQQHLITVQPKKDVEGTRKDVADYLPEIFNLLQSGLGHDFSHYKEKTILRRVQRRMQVLQIDNIPDFIQVLKDDPNELELLFHDLLIGVTQFFRDPEAFKTLETEVIPKILENKTTDSTVRIWVVACSTGQEAYSIAILLAEAISQLPVTPKVLIFATDIDAPAVAFARNGRYLKSQLEGVSPERLKRWFVQEGEYYTVYTQVREMCIFSTHSVVKDPPFSNLDLLSCRNLMIYLDAALQDRLVPIFHYALRPGGYLFLGASEGVGHRSELFTTLDEKARLFVRQDEVTAPLPYYPMFTSLHKNNKMNPVPAIDRRENTFERGARRVMERYSPAHVVIDRQHQVLSFSGQTGKYLDPSPGAASLNFFHLIQKALRPTARIALQEAFNTQMRVVKERIPFETSNGLSETVTLIVEPILQASGEAMHYIVVFQQTDETSDEMAEAHPLPESSQVGLEQLENELRATKARLQAAIDEAEEANEDLKSFNEELQSMNEELHSSNEELETSKEEMQSMNEELQAVNVELSNKNQLLVRVNSDLQNFLESTQIATLFLDEALCVRSFTPSVTDLFHLRESDKGRPVTEVTGRLNYDTLEQDVKYTLEHLESLEREVYLPESDSTFLMNIRPYRTVTKVVEGVVITFVDISERKRHETDLNRLVAIVESSQDAIIGHLPDGTLTSWNKGAQSIFGYTATEAIGQSITMLVAENQASELLALLTKVQNGEQVAVFSMQCINKNNRPVDVSLTISPVLGAEGTIVSASTIARDMGDYVRAEQQKTLLLGELNHRVKNTLSIIQSIARQTRKGAESMDAFYDAFESRLMAVSRTHNLLTQGNWQGASLRDIFLDEFSPYDGGQFVLEGEVVQLNAQQTLTMGLAIHEMVTNAAKYGALSVPTGQVKVAWTVTPTSKGQQRLQIHWVEIGGPTVTTPKRKGFGSKLLERSFEGEEQGSVEISYEAAGVGYTIQFVITEEKQ